MVNNIDAQQWLDKKYPKNGACKRDNDQENKSKKRADITELDLRKGKVGSFFSGYKNLVSSLKLEKFTNLRKLIVSSHHLVNLDVSNCSNLEELDCRSNQLTSLNVTSCSNLKKVDCSNNNLKELDLTSCFKLEEVNISGCPNLNEETIKSNLTYDAEKGKLAKDSAKNSPQIRKVKDNDIRNILIVGMTGSGKSTLANVLTNSSEFKESILSTSETKNFQAGEVFQWQGNNYRIIDNIGFGDTANISNEDVLFEIGKGIHSAKEGINQILFVFKDRFSEEQITAFNLFKNFINETGITKFTTLARTNFEHFRDPQICEEDRKSLLTKTTKALTEIINSCNGIIYVNNPAIPVIEEESSEGETKEKKRALIDIKKRKKSREIVLNHLAKNCLEIYKLKEWDSIVSKVNEYNEKKQHIEQSNSPTKEKELQKAKSETTKEINKGIKASVGVEVPGLPVGLSAAFEYNTQKKWF